MTREPVRNVVLGPSSAEVSGNEIDEGGDGTLDNGFIGGTCTVGQGACEATGALISNDAGTGTDVMH